MHICEKCYHHIFSLLTHLYMQMNVCLFYGDPTYKEELLQVSAAVLQSITNIVLLESNQVSCLTPLVLSLL